MKRYDCGLINDYGGGDVSWWQDYIRAEVERCSDYYEEDLARTRNELELNKKMLSRQCDLAREAETKLEELRGKVCNVMRLKEEWFVDEIDGIKIQGTTDEKFKRLLEAEADLRAAVEKQATVPE